MCIYIYRYIYAYIYVYIHIYIYIYTYLHICIYLYVHIYMYIYVNLYICIYALSMLHCVYFQYVDLYMTMQAQINSFKIFVCVSLSLCLLLSFSLSDIALNALLCSGALQCVTGCSSVLHILLRV